MPIYVYACPTCKVTKEEIVQSSTVPFIPPCPLCGKDMERQQTAASFTIK